MNSGESNTQWRDEFPENLNLTPDEREVLGLIDQDNTALLMRGARIAAILLKNEIEPLQFLIFRAVKDLKGKAYTAEIVHHMVQKYKGTQLEFSPGGINLTIVNLLKQGLLLRSSHPDSNEDQRIKGAVSLSQEAEAKLEKVSAEFKEVNKAS